ncbi:MAG TPA: SusC/RagA family TonB-linked outer membrane protein [Chitinophagaceae bacterium]
MNLPRLPKLMLLLVLLFSSMLAVSQELTISGKVIDQQSGKPLDGVTVKVKNNPRTTLTDENGNFSIAVPSAESVLSFTYVGYMVYEVQAGTGASLTVNLNLLNSRMEEVVVVGYGTKKRANVLGSVGSVNPKEVEDMPFVNLSTALVNKVPGVSVSLTSGKPGATTNLRIRNPITFGNTGSVDPLFVIDGVAYNNPEGKEFFDNLDATMVESISFLKDAAASVYGSRGANGVVLVATKRGKPGKPRVSYTGSYGISDALKIPETLTAYEHAIALNNKYAARPAWRNAGLMYTQQELDYLKTHNNNWLDEVWQNSYLTRHAINVSGGSDKITFFGGANYLKETGNLQDLFATRYGFRIGSTAKITDNLNIDIAFSQDNAVQDRPTPKGIASFAGQNADQADQLNATIGALMLIPKWVPMYIDGKPVFTTAPGWHPKEVQNTNTYARTDQKGQSITASLNYKIPFVQGLSFRLSYGNNNRTTFGKEYYVSYNLYDFQRESYSTLSSSGVTKQAVIFTNVPTTSNPVRSIRNGNSLRNASDYAKSYQLNQSLNYKREFGKHDIDVLVLAEQSESEANGYFASVEGQVIPGVDEFWGFTLDRSVYDHASSKSEIGRASYLGRVNYSFMDRYLLEASFRADASPNFPSNSRWGYFPSVAVGWKISEEEFFKGVGFVNDLKIRFQVGTTGSDAVRPYQYSERYTQTTGYLFGNTLTNGLNPNAIPNPDITWEKAFYKNLGFDGSFLNRKFNFAIDLFHRTNSDMLQSPVSTVPSTFGGTISDRNYAEIKAWGIEGSIGYEGKIGKDFGYSIQTNLGYSDNKVIKKYFGANDTAWKNPIGVRTDRGIEGYIATGIVRSQAEVDAFYAKNPGWLINGDSLRVGYLNFQDLDGDGRITENDRTRIASRSGSIWGAGFNIGFSWKGLRLSINTSLSVGGSRIYDNTARRPPTENQGALSFWRDTWSESNPNARYPVINSPLASETSTFWMVGGTTMRVNNAQLSYTLPPSLKTRYKIPDLRLFVTGTNLGTLISNEKYKDASANVAVDYPVLRTITFGANISL